MKGMLDFLEKAGLVRQDAPAPPDAAPDTSSARPAPEREPAATGISPPGSSVGADAPLNLDTIYAQAGIAPSLYPAERLLRLLDGLSAMDEATRLMAIRAMDAADESWSIEDPLADAAAKVQALTAHAEQLQLALQAQARETEAGLAAIAARQAQVVGDIRKQIAELEALAERELTRAAQETAAQQARLQAAQDQGAQELAAIARISQRLQGLATQFSPVITAAKE